MADEPESIVLEYLRRIDRRLENIEGKLDRFLARDAPPVAQLSPDMKLKCLDRVNPQDLRLEL